MPVPMFTYHWLFLDRSQTQLTVEQEEADVVACVLVNTRPRTKRSAERTLYPADPIASRRWDPLHSLRNCIACIASGHANNMFLPCTHGIADHCGICSYIRRI